MFSREEAVKRLEERGIRVVPRARIVSMFRSLGVELDDRPPTKEELEEVRKILSRSSVSLSDMIIRDRGEH